MLPRANSRHGLSLVNFCERAGVAVGRRGWPRLSETKKDPGRADCRYRYKYQDAQKAHAFRDSRVRAADGVADQGRCRGLSPGHPTRPAALLPPCRTRFGAVGLRLPVRPPGYGTDWQTDRRIRMSRGRSDCHSFSAFRVLYRPNTATVLNLSDVMINTVAAFCCFAAGVTISFP